MFLKSDCKVYFSVGCKSNYLNVQVIPPAQKPIDSYFGRVNLIKWPLSPKRTGPCSNVQ